MSLLLHTRARLAAGARRTVAKRPWLQWFLIVALAIGVAASVHDRMAALDAERAAWGTTVEVWIGNGDHEIGDEIAAAHAEIPAAVVPDGAVADSPTGMAARQRIGRGEIITDGDVMAPDDEDALAPAGWLITPLDEPTPSGATLGERVQVVSGGYVIADRGVVVGFVEEVTLVALPADIAPLVPAAAESADVTLLRVP